MFIKVVTVREDEVTYVNVDNIFKISPDNGGTHITYGVAVTGFTNSDVSNMGVTVRETPAQVMKMINKGNK